MDRKREAVAWMFENTKNAEDFAECLRLTGFSAMEALDELNYIEWSKEIDAEGIIKEVYCTDTMHELGKLEELEREVYGYSIERSY